MRNTCITEGKLRYKIINIFLSTHIDGLNLITIFNWSLMKAKSYLENFEKQGSENK